MTGAPLFTLLGWAVAVPVTLPLLTFASELFTGLRASAPLPPSAADASAVPRCAILIPAHNEAHGIAATLATLMGRVPAGTRIVVIADNCNDTTAQIARDAGAEVAERHDLQARGKGYALAFGRDYLANGALPLPDAVIVLDADCRLTDGSVQALTHAAVTLDVPVQAVNLIEEDLNAPPMVQISNFAMLVKNLYRSRGMQRMGGAALLTGTGMAFPWHHLASADLANGAIVEDLALGLRFTRDGQLPRLIETAGVRSASAAIGDALVQRRRWEHGFLDTLRRDGVPLLMAGLRQLSKPITLLGLHLLVPPLALLLMVAGAALVVLAGLGWAGGGAAPFAVLGASFAAALIAVILGWFNGGRHYLTASALARAPLYVLWKIPLYLGFFKARETRWTRTPRDGDSA